jgi:uncharacterized protein (DUF302 family)
LFPVLLTENWKHKTVNRCNLFVIQYHIFVYLLKHITMKYYFEKTTNYTFEEAIEKVTAELKKEGFGIITEVNMHDKLKEKLGVDFRKYKILGACNPPLAYEALQVENKIGTMLPCNVIVQEISENQTEIAAVDPVASMMAIENPQLGKMALAIQQKLKNVIERV